MSRTHEQIWPPLAHKATHSLARRCRRLIPNASVACLRRSPIQPSLPRAPLSVGAVVAPPHSFFPPPCVNQAWPGLAEAATQVHMPHGRCARKTWPAAWVHLDACLWGGDGTGTLAGQHQAGETGGLGWRCRRPTSTTLFDALSDFLISIIFL